MRAKQTYRSIATIQWPGGWVTIQMTRYFVRGLPDLRSTWLSVVDLPCGARCGTGHAVNQMPARKRRMETRTRPPPRFRPQPANPGCRCRVSPSARSPYYGPFRVSFWAPLTWLTAFRSAYLGPQVHLGAEPIG